jgi:hypothetical protein
MLNLNSKSSDVAIAHTERALADPKQEESFRVIDRRLFNAEGEIRGEAAEERRKQEEPAAPPLNAPSGAAKKDAGPAASKPSTPASAPPSTLKDEAVPEGEVAKPSRGFQMLINFVAQNAAMLLGAYPDPRGQAMLDLDGARELIDMLDALREATRGNLAPDDDRLLLDVLGSLKLSYMEMTKAAAKAMQEKAKARP